LDFDVAEVGIEHLDDLLEEDHDILLLRGVWILLSLDTPDEVGCLVLITLDEILQIPDDLAAAIIKQLIYRNLDEILFIDELSQVFLVGEPLASVRLLHHGLSLFVTEVNFRFLSLLLVEVRI